MRRFFWFLIFGLPLVAAENKRLHANTRHVLVPADQVESVLEAGGHIVAGTRGDDVIASVPDTYAADSIAPVRKLSKAITATSSDKQHYLVVFHPDVTAADAEQVLNYAAVTRLDRPDLLQGQFLIQATAQQLEKLTSWDEIGYIYPASDELISGSAVHGCQGPLTEHGLIAQYVQTVGQGWDGTGRRSVELTYSIGRLTEKLPSDQIVDAIERALAKWSQHAKLRFTRAAQTDAARNLNFHFAAGEHGDFYPFDGRGRVLAHTFYPAGVNIEPIAGDLHFDEDELWQSTSTDFFSVVLHEMGHALGLGHSDQPTAVMYPYYRRSAELQADDIEALQKLYAAPDQTSATPAPSGPATPGAMLLSIQSPATVSTGRVSISGAVLSGGNNVLVTWRVGTIGGTADGGAEWVARDIPMDFGSNTITVTATNASGATVTKSVTVVRAEEPASTNKDNVAPSVTIIQPASTLSSTSAATAKIKGTAKDNIGVSTIKWSTSGGGSGTATGTSSWEALGVPLLMGDNIITIRAVDAAGNTGKRTLTITRR